ncbi:hypothetical protein EJ03DRAFT_356252 [Teratosphaeria nubilosa]|uniref:Increased loss of mitochondrial DNA protein 1 n=1 Tax=Teratosphaeria nubilosa TaxID=161662 RepID=A0A6G1KV21_9PEZI|nr:hypothetical protein EJ03DRAFT_356252 [Teratosphaeria nubilosa]
MALISPFTIIRAISLFHITAAYFFLTAPRMIADQNVVFILGESMRLPHVTSMDKPSQTSAFLAVVLTLLGLSDLTAANMNEEVALQYWLANVPVRLTFLFVMTGYAYLFKEDGLFGLGRRVMGKPGIGEPLQNSLVFAFGFVEIATWFWIFNSLRDERNRLAIQRAEKMKAEEDRL